MLADFPQSSASSGALRRDLHLAASSLHELLKFVANELSTWRDRSDRRPETSETSLTSQLCSHLNSASRLSVGWDFLQFRTEVPDENTRGRTIDLVASPSATTVWVDGRRHIDFDSLLPIECKRLPTPRGDGRDEREYVFNQYASTGGIQRFKAGHHGASHKLGAMIGYIQQGKCIFWDAEVANWIRGLIASAEKGWTEQDLLNLERDDIAQRMAILVSSHTRENGLFGH